MSLFSHKGFSIGILLSLIALVFLITYYPLSTSPNQFILSYEGDGFKNYFGAMYQIQYEDQAVLNKSMYYPWHSHMIYVDVIPVYVWSMKALAGIFPGVMEYKVGVFHSLILLSYLLCGVFVFLLLSRFNIPNWANIVVSLPIVLLSPQIYRITGHYGLAYAYIIPLWLLMLHEYFLKPRTLILLAISASTLLSIFIHPYHGFNGIVLFSIFSLVAFFFHYREHKNIALSLKINIGPIIAVFFAFALFMVFMKLTDTETDRVSNPYGMMEYRSKMEGLFFPVHGPIYKFLKSYEQYSVPSFEAYAYVGLPATLFYLATILSFLGSRIKRFQNSNFPTLRFFEEQKWLRYLFISALFIYLLAMAYPMRLGMGFLMDLIPPIKQFRSLGRLAWLVHYILVISCIVFWWQQFKAYYLEKRNIKALWFFLPLLAFWYWEVYVHFNGVRKNANITANVFLKEQKGKLLPDIPYEKYQCIASLPTYLIGTEKMGTVHGFSGVRYTMVTSYHSGLPCLDGMLTRLPILKSQYTWKSFAHPALLSPIWDSLPSDKPILVMRDKTSRCATDSILTALKKIYSNDTIDFYEMPVTFMKDLHQQYERKLEYLRKKAIPFVHLGYEEFKSEKSFSGQGALCTSDDSTFLYRGRPALLDSSVFELSLWSYLNYDKVGMQRFPYIIYRNAEVLKGHIPPNSSYDIYNGWMRGRAVLPPLLKSDSLVVYVRYDKTWVDDLELRLLDSNSHRKIGSSEFLNNYPISTGH